MVHQCNDLMTRKAVMSDTSTEYRKPGKYLLDSTFFVAFELAHEGLKEGLREASCLNCTQYRVLVKLAAAEPEPIGQKNLGIILDLKPNVITHAVNTLEDAGFVERIHTPGKRGSRVRVLESGIKHIEQANPAIIAQLYRIFPTQTAPFRAICEAAVMAGATIEPPLSREMSRKFFASRALASFEVLRKRIEKALEESCDGATFSECRVLQRLGEVGYPMRIVDLARQLKLTSATAVRATDRLAERGWVERMSAPDDHKAVYVACTDEGRHMQDVVLASVDRIATQYLWSRLAPEKCRDIAMAGHVVMADLQQREEAERLSTLAQLRPLKQ